MSSSFGKASNPGQTQTGLGPRVYPFTTSDCCTAESGAGSDGVEPAMQFFIKNRQTLCSMGYLMYGICY